MKKTSNLLWLIIIVLWTAMIALLFSRDLRRNYQAIISSAAIEGRASFNKDLVYRRWAASHGGLYVPVTERTPPNPNLSHIPDRDLHLPSGKNLTLMNPAYMTRQVNELAEAQYGVKGHITSLNPIRANNRPDDWERQALEGFETGKQYAQDIRVIDGEKYLRSMYPMITEALCLKCHAQQGYKVGAIRGGISVSVPLKPYEQIYERLVPGQSVQYVIIWVVGALGLLVVREKINRQFTTINAQLVESRLLTERLAEQEQHLKESELKYRMLFDNAAHGSAVADVKTGEIIACNKALADMVGRRVDELIGQPQNILHADQGVAGERTKNFKKYIGGEYGQTFEDQLIDAEGNLIDVEIKANRINIEGRELLHGFFYNVSDRKKLMEEYRRAAQLAALGTVAAGVAHEINNPIQGILNYATLIKGKPEKLERTVEIAERIIVESERIAGITRELLDFARDNRNQMIRTDICPLIESAIDLIEKKIIRQGISIETSCPDGLPGVLVYPQGIQQIVINLIDNASDAMQYKEMPLADKIIQVFCYEAELDGRPHICLEVADRGVGMTTEVLSKARETFFSTKPSSRGSGLGLSIVNDIINRHNGVLTIDSVAGEYTRVMVYIPVAEATAAEACPAA